MRALPISRALVLLGLLTLAACRPEVGDPDYSTQELFDFDNDEGNNGESEFLDGPDPYVAGETRLSLSAFYEGGASQTIAIDNTTRHFYIYADEFNGASTFVQTAADDRIEGTTADRIALTGNAWWGGGIHWDSPIDLSEYGTLNISLKSGDDAFDEVDFGMEDAAGGSGMVGASDYGYTNDGQWHTLSVPLSDFGVDLSQVSSPLQLLGGAGPEGESVLVDNVYLTP